MPRDTLFGIEEAPVDGTPYGRVDADWKSVPSEAPLDDKSYTRQNATWVEIGVAEPPKLAIEFLVPNAALIASAPVIVEAHGTAFTATTIALRDGVAMPTTYVSPTELTFTLDPKVETAVRSITVTVSDGGVAGAGDAPFYFRASDKLYQGTWKPVTNVPDLIIPPKGDKWMWIADTADPRQSEIIPTTIPGIGGQLIREGDSVVWDAATNMFTLIATRSLSVTEVIPCEVTIGTPATEANVHGTGFTATTQVLWEGLPIPTTFLDVNKLRITIDPTQPAPTRGFAVINVNDGAVVGRGGVGVNFVAPTPDFGKGLSVDRTQTPAIVNLTPAGWDAKFLGGVYGSARTAIQGLDLAAAGTGEISVPLATDLLAGAIVEPPPDALLYVRTRTTAGVSAWVPSAGTDFGKGLSVDRTQTPPIVNLTPAGNTEKFLGGVYVPLRAANQGLVVETTTGALVAPLATPLLAGTIVEPADDKLYARGGGVTPRWERTVDEAPLDVKQYARSDGGWVEVVGGVTISDTPPQNATPGQLWWESDTGATFIWYDDGTGAQWVQTDGGSSGGAVYTSDAPPAAPAANSLWWDSDSGKMYVNYTDVDSTQWVECIGSAPGPATVTVADFAPASPVVNQLWWSSTDSNMYMYYDDGSSAQWVQVSGDGVEQLPTAGGTMSGCINWSPASFSATNYATHLRLNKDPTYQMGISATTNGALNYMIENTGNKHQFHVGGVIRMEINNTGTYYPGGGMNFGRQVVTKHDDFSRHIAIYGVSNDGFGFTVSSGTLNYCVSAGGNQHRFWGADEAFGAINNTGWIVQKGGYSLQSDNEEIAAFAPDAIGTYDDEEGEQTVRTYRIDKVLEVAVAKIRQLQADIEALQAKMKIITDLT